MNKKGFAYFLVVALILASIIFSSGDLVRAQDYVISGNGADSQNSIDVSTQKSTIIEQSAQGGVVNDVKAKADTGSNQGPATTGDATSVVNINNRFNINQAQISDCCVTPTVNPTLKPSVTPSAEPTPTSTPGGGGGNGGSSSSSSDSGGGNGGSSSGGEVLGASTEGEVLPISGDNSIMIYTIIGFLTLATGIYFRFSPQASKYEEIG